MSVGGAVRTGVYYLSFAMCMASTALSTHRSLPILIPFAYINAHATWVAEHPPAKPQIE